MTPYNVYENAYIAQSELGEACPVLGDMTEIRNTTYGTNIRGIISDVSPRGFLRNGTLAGDIELIISNNTSGTGGIPYFGWPFAFCKHDKYIYTLDYNYTYTGDDGLIKVVRVREYDTDTNQLGDPVIVVELPSIRYNIRMAYLEDKKLAILVHDGSYLPHLYTVDMIAGTSTEDTNIDTLLDDIIFLYSKKREDGNVWLYMYGLRDYSTYGYDQYTVRYRNITAGGEWQYTHITGLSDAGTVWQSSRFVADKYLIIPCSEYVSYVPKCYFLRFDLDTGIVEKSNTVTGTTSRPWTHLSSGVDNTTEFFYLSVNGVTSLGGGLYRSWDGLISYDAATNTATIEYTRYCESSDSANTYYTIILTSNVRAYYVKKPQREVYYASDNTYLSTIASSRTFYYNLTMAIDDSDEYVWVYDTNTLSLYKVSLSDGEDKQTIYCAPLSGWTIDYTAEVLLAQDGIILNIKTQQAGTYNYQWDAFWIT